MTRNQTFHLIQSKYQKHQAFEAEYDANEDRVGSVVNVGRQLIDAHHWAGSEDAVQVVMFWKLHILFKATASFTSIFCFFFLSRNVFRGLK